MKHSLVRILLASAAAVFLIAGCASNSGPKDSTMNYWDKKKGDCEDVLKSPHAYDLSRVAYCTKMWETYRYVDKISTKDRSRYAVAFSMVSYNSSDPYDRGIADAALTRVCIPRHPMDADGQIREEIPETLDCNTQMTDISIAGQAVASANRFEPRKRTVQVGEVSDAEFKASNVAYKKATEQRKKKAYGKAVTLYKEALVHNPYNVSAKYNLACVLSLQDDEQAALYQLEELYTWDDYEAERRLEEARTSSDFDNIRDNPNFKLMTGYVRVAMINGARNIGAPMIATMKKKLEARSIPIAEVGRSTRVEMQPQIWYRDGFEDYAQKIKDVIGIQKISVKAMKNSDLRDNDSGNDVLVVWGQPEASINDTVGQKPPVVQGKPVQGSSNKLDDVLQEAEQQKQTTDHAKQVGDSLTEKPF